MKTVMTDASVQSFVDTVEHAGRREDAQKLLEIYRDVTGAEPKMWGSSIVGYGSYKYARADGSQHVYALAGFSPRKANMSIYLMSGCENHSEKLEGLGPHKHSVSCLYVGRLAKVDFTVLRELIADDIEIMKDRYRSASL
ncbi:MAG: DUF1801 domain-containing protein [Pseudomonadota bacterium]